MKENTDQHLQPPAKPDSVLMAIACLLTVAVVGFLDYLTGYYVGFAIFYLLPIGAATWWTGRGFGVLVAAISTLAWWLADRCTAPPEVPALIAAWNAVMRLGIFLIVNRTLSALRKALDLQSAMARTDHVTGAANARGFYETAQHELDRARRSGRPLTAVFIDLDDFKRTNDRLGHVAGNQLLRTWSDTARSQIRSIDLFGRVGGDEFAILLTDTPEESACEMVGLLQARLVHACSERRIPFTFSMGAITLVTPPGSFDTVVG